MLSTFLIFVFQKKEDILESSPLCFVPLHCYAVVYTATGYELAWVWMILVWTCTGFMQMASEPSEAGKWVWKSHWQGEGKTTSINGYSVSSRLACGNTSHRGICRSNSRATTAWNSNLSSSFTETRSLSSIACNKNRSTLIYSEVMFWTTGQFLGAVLTCMWWD